MKLQEIFEHLTHRKIEKNQHSKNPKCFHLSCYCSPNWYVYGRIDCNKNQLNHRYLTVYRKCERMNLLKLSEQKKFLPRLFLSKDWRAIAILFFLLPFSGKTQSWSIFLVRQMIVAIFELCSDHFPNGSFTLARFVCKNANDIALRYHLPYLPWPPWAARHR